MGGCQAAGRPHCAPPVHRTAARTCRGTVRGVMAPRGGQHLPRGRRIPAAGGRQVDGPELSAPCHRSHPPAMRTLCAAPHRTSTLPCCSVRCARSCLTEESDRELSLLHFSGRPAARAPRSGRARRCSGWREGGGRGTARSRRPHLDGVGGQRVGDLLLRAGGGLHGGCFGQGGQPGTRVGAGAPGRQPSGRQPHHLVLGALPQLHLVVLCVVLRPH